MTDPLPDPIAYARGLSDAELADYRRVYGETSREWVIARDEIARRRRRPPLARWIGLAIWLVAVGFVAWRPAGVSYVPDTYLTPT